MSQANDLSRCLTALDQDSTLIAVLEMSQSSWLVAGIIPGIERHPAKPLEPNEVGLLRLRQRWQAEAERSGRQISRIAVASCSSQGQAFEAGRDGVWLARWLRRALSTPKPAPAQAGVIPPNSIAVSREHRRANTDRLDTALLKRAFLGWLRGEPDHCQMIAIPTLEEADATRPGRDAKQRWRAERTRIIKRFKSTLVGLGIRGFKPHLRTAATRLATLRTPEGAPLPDNTLAALRREMTRLQLITEPIRAIESARLERLKQQPSAGAHRMIRLLAQVRGVGVETADMLAHEAFLRPRRDQRAVARGACPRAGRRPDPGGGLTGAPDESVRRRREKDLARAGNARVRRGMIQFAWRFLIFQKDSRLARWSWRRTVDLRGAPRKTMIVTLARKRLVAPCSGQGQACGGWRPSARFPRVSSAAGAVNGRLAVIVRAVVVPVAGMTAERR